MTTTPPVLLLSPLLPLLTALLMSYFCSSARAACTTHEDCSLNGLCTAGACECDAPWTGERCQTMQLAPGIVGLHDLPLCAYHGDGPNSTSWGGSVLHAPEDGKYYMWVASMVNNCTLDDWMTNSEVVLAVSQTPLGPFEKVKTIVPPWAHNPQAIRAPDNGSKSGYVYVLYTLGDGHNYHGSPKNCGPLAPAPPVPPAPPGPPWAKGCAPIRAAPPSVSAIAGVSFTPCCWGPQALRPRNARWRVGLHGGQLHDLLQRNGRRRLQKAHSSDNRLAGP